MFWTVTERLLAGFGNTLIIFALTLIFSLPLGVLICIGCRSKWKAVRVIFKSAVWAVRGVPLMLQIFIVYYVPGFLFGAPIAGRLTAVVIAFALNYACYFGEIFRGGIDSLPKGQAEAAFVLGLSKTETFFKVQLPQIFKRVLPPVSNEVITLVKDTALARVVTVAEIIFAAEQFAAKAIIWPLFYTGLFYLIFVGALTLLFNLLEKKMSYYKIQ